MGGGKKKSTMTQMAKAQGSEEDKGKSKTGKRSETARSEKKTLGIMLPDLKDKGITKELQKMKALTPYTVASRFNLRLSVAKDLLEELQHQGVITYVSGGKNIKIYKPSA